MARLEKLSPEAKDFFLLRIVEGSPVSRAYSALYSEFDSEYEYSLEAFYAYKKTEDWNTDIQDFLNRTKDIPVSKREARIRILADLLTDLTSRYKAGLDQLGLPLSLKERKDLSTEIRAILDQIAKESEGLEGSKSKAPINEAKELLDFLEKGNNAENNDPKGDSNVLFHGSRGTETPESPQTTNL